MYSMERNGVRNPDAIKRIFLPIIKKKIDYLHAEGVAQLVWSLARAEVWDQDIWTKLAQQVIATDFDY